MLIFCMESSNDVIGSLPLVCHGSSCNSDPMSDDRETLEGGIVEIKLNTRFYLGQEAVPCQGICFTHKDGHHLFKRSEARNAGFYKENK